MEYFEVIVVCLGLTLCQGSVEFIQIPGSLRLTDTGDQLTSAQLPDVISQAMGLSTPAVVEWSGLQPKSLFVRPKANLLFVDHKHRQQMDDSDLNDLSFHQRLNEVYTSMAKPLIVLLNPSGKVTSSDDVISDAPAGSIPESVLESLDSTERELVQKQPRLIRELGQILQLSHQITSHKMALEDAASDSFVFHLTSVGFIATKYGEHSHEHRAASKVMDQVVKQVCSDLSDAYRAQLLCERTWAETAQGWSGRRLLQVSANTVVRRPSNPAPVYDALFPITFNIVLGLSIFVILAILLVSHSMWYMDPGRDSIIYRMTTQRLKKD